MDIYRDFIENSINPFILFDATGEVLEYNKEGEYILSVVSKEELFNLAISHASMSFGFKHSFIELDIGHASFCAITVGYKDSERLGLMLHKSVCSKKLTPTSQELQSANIFTLIDIAINTNLDESNKITAEYDISIPDFKLDINRFLQLLNKIFKALRDAAQIYIKVTIATGRSIKIGDKKYQVVAIEIRSQEIEKLAIKDEEFILTYHKDRLIIELPFIL